MVLWETGAFVQKEFEKPGGIGEKEEFFAWAKKNQVIKSCDENIKIDISGGVGGMA